MPEITPEERIQKILAPLLEDLEFEPAQVRNFYVSNIFGRVFAHLVGWTGKKALVLQCTSAGELKTAPTTTGIEYNDTKGGDAGDDYGGFQAFDKMASRLDIFIWDNPAIIKRSLDGVSPQDEIEVPVGFYSIDARTHSFDIKNKDTGLVARYQVVGWW